MGFHGDINVKRFDDTQHGDIIVNTKRKSKENGLTTFGVVIKFFSEMFNMDKKTVVSLSTKSVGRGDRRVQIHHSDVKEGPYSAKHKKGNSVYAYEELTSYNEEDPVVVVGKVTKTVAKEIRNSLTPHGNNATLY